MVMHLNRNTSVYRFSLQLIHALKMPFSVHMSTVRFSPVTHAIFDVDGLLLDTEKLYTKTQEQTLEKYGFEYSWDIKKDTLGRCGKEIPGIIVNLFNIDVTAEEYMAEYDANFTLLLQDVQLLPGAERLVRHLYSCQIPISVCTGARKSHYAPKVLRHQQLFSLFDPVVIASADCQVKQGKLAPDGFLVTANRFLAPPTNMDKVLVFEDAPTGVQAALRAGMQVVMVRDSRVDDSIKQSATLCLNSLTEFQPHLFSLPPFP